MRYAPRSDCHYLFQPRRAEPRRADEESRSFSINAPPSRPPLNYTRLVPSVCLPRGRRVFINLRALRCALIVRKWDRERRVRWRSMSSMATAIRYKFIIDGLISATRRILYVHKSKLYLDGTIESRSFYKFILRSLDLFNTFIINYVKSRLEKSWFKKKINKIEFF